MRARNRSIRERILVHKPVMLRLSKEEEGSRWSLHCRVSFSSSFTRCTSLACWEHSWQYCSSLPRVRFHRIRSLFSSHHNTQDFFFISLVSLLLQVLCPSLVSLLLDRHHPHHSSLESWRQVLSSWSHSTPSLVMSRARDHLLLHHHHLHHHHPMEAILVK